MAMVTVGAFEAKTHFSSLLERVAQGEEIVITRHGAPVAKLTPFAGGSREQVRATIARLKEFSKGQSLGGLSVRELREKGRR
jgi:prevent-host-death family protein